MRPSFKKTEHEKYDLIGRKYARAIALRYGMFLANNPDPYGIDLLVYNLNNGEFLGYADVEIRPDLWKGDKTIFKTVHAIQKKVENYSKLDYPAWYFSLSGDGKYLLSCKFSDMLDTKLIEVKNKRGMEGEKFYDVPLSKWKRLSLV